MRFNLSCIQPIILWMFCRLRLGELLVSRSVVRRHGYVRKMKTEDSAGMPVQLPSTRILGKQIIVLAGATSVGKSAVAAELCKILDAEIILADSVQVTAIRFSVIIPVYPFINVLVEFFLCSHSIFVSILMSPCQ